MNFNQTIYETETIRTGVEHYYSDKSSGIRILRNVAKKLSTEAKEEGIVSGEYLYYPGKESWALAIFELGIEGQGLMVPAKKTIALKHHRYIINNNLQELFNMKFDNYGSPIASVS